MYVTYMYIYIYTLYTQCMENYYSTYDYHDPLCHASHDTPQVEFDLSMKARSVSTVSLRWCRSYRCSWDCKWQNYGYNLQKSCDITS